MASASASASARVDKSIVYTLFLVLAFSSLLYLWYCKSDMIYMGVRPLILYKALQMKKVTLIMILTYYLRGGDTL